ncbi:hypothetical protein [Mycobacterium sp. D16R24]|uniref:hypothetical protein n=1 Tax=Mycobacterium sp. D16R24 TaxID=1855656 RepID=UPI00099218F9|nr:hypothetical protein [Mycobacterium sp. D16R24]
MASKKVNVAVYDGDRLVTKLAARPVRLMPDGYAGVVYNAAVYPLYTDDCINLADEPVDKDDCGGFVPAYKDTPYAPEDGPTDGDDDAGHLGIEAWYLESNQFGHYLVFDASETAARRLVEAVESRGLGVRRWDESSRPADNGQFYDWFIRLGFTGSREECLRQLADLLVDEQIQQDDGPSEVLADAESDSGSAHLEEVLDAVLAAGTKDLDTGQVVEFLELLDLEGSGEHLGYFSWRYREAMTRPGSAFDGSVESRLRVLATIAKDDKELLARLIRSYGRFLDQSRGLTRSAIEAEFDRVDLDASWRSAEDALRRARASTIFLIHASLLIFGDDDCREQLIDKVRQLSPPEPHARRQHPQNVTAAIGNLERMIGFVEQLLCGDLDDFEERFVNGQDELLALERGDFDFITELASVAKVSAGAVDGDLPFVVLPPGELIQSFITELRAKGSYKGREIDLKRVEVLKRLEDYFPEARCRIHRGAFPSSGRDNLYVVLSIAHPGGRGEDAVAISPCRGEHATFVVRHDCGSGLPWHVVLSQTKREAKLLGARRLLFTSKSGRGIDEYEAMLGKLLRLLKSEPEDFDWGGASLDEELHADDGRPGWKGGRAGEGGSSPGAVGKIVNWILRRR